MNKKQFTVTLVLLIAPGLLLAARPSINELNTRVNQLEAENNAQQAEIDALRTDVDEIQAALTPSCENLTNPAPNFCVRRVFVSNSAVTGDFGGVAAADAICQADADAFSLGGTWKAWLSDSTSSPATSFFRAGKYVDLEGVKIADGWVELVREPVAPFTPLDAPLNLTADGTRLTQPTESAWTGTDVFGEATPENCLDWILTSGEGITATVGLVNATDDQWTSADFGEGAECGESRRFYCFEQ